MTLGAGPGPTGPRTSQGHADPDRPVHSAAQPAAEEREPADDAVLPGQELPVAGGGGRVADVRRGRDLVAGGVAAQVAGADEDVRAGPYPLHLPGVGGRPHAERVAVADHPHGSGDRGAVLAKAGEQQVLARPEPLQLRVIHDGSLVIPEQPWPRALLGV